MPNTVLEGVDNYSSAPLDDCVPITPGVDPLADGPCRVIKVDADGTINYKTVGGLTRTGVMVFKGYNPIVATHILAMTGPTKIEACY